MSYSMTYSSLLEDARNYLERGFTEASDPIVFTMLPRLVTFAERRCAQELKVQGFIKATTTTTSVGVSTYAKPDRWRDTISMTVGGRPVFARSTEYCKNYWPNPSVTDTPEFYADYDYAHWLIAPTPAAAEVLEVLYYEQPPLLGDSVQTNWLTDYAPTLLLYATLLEATPMLKNDERVAVWQQMYDRSASTLNGQDLLKVLDRASQRTEA